MTATTKTYLLTGDVGGTNSRMSLYEFKNSNNYNSIGGGSGDDDEPIVVKFFRNSESLPASTHNDPNSFAKYIISPFLRHCHVDKNVPLLISSSEDGAEENNHDDVEILVCLATAGLVMNNAVRMTNLGNLLVDGNRIQNATQNIDQDPIVKADKYLRLIARCIIINDFVAQGYGCLTLKSSEVQHLYGPLPEPMKASKKDGASAFLLHDHLPVGPKVCVGAGTGLGECYLTPNPPSPISGTVDYSCHPSEGGHVEYAPRNEVEVGLWKYLSNKFASKNRISVERVVSGKGLANVYEYLSKISPRKVNKKIHEEFLNAGDDQGRVVAMNAVDLSSSSSSSKGGKNQQQHADNVCRQAMDIMMSAYGCEVGSSAIKFLPLGGLFVTGGLTPKNMHFIHGNDTDFMKSYIHKGRVSPVLQRIPLYAVTVEDLGIRGVHHVAIQECKQLIQTRKQQEQQRQLQEQPKKPLLTKNVTTSSSSMSILDFLGVLFMAILSFALGMVVEF